MAVARDDRAAGLFDMFLAGLQAGMLAALWMLAWLGVSAAWQRSSFWTAENLLASTFFGGAAIRSGFGSTTFSGLALFLLVYSALGGLFAIVARGRLSRLRLVLVSLVLGIAWYYLFYDVICRTVSPLVTLLYAERPTLLGHVIYGGLLARFPRYVPQAAPPELEVPVVETVTDVEPANRTQS